MKKISPTSLSSFEEFILRYKESFTSPSFENFKTLVEGWILTPGRKTITNIIQSAYAQDKKHHSCYYNFFSRAQWNIQDLSKKLEQELVKSICPQDKPIITCGDDTLYAKTGSKTYGTGLFRDPVLSSKKQTVFRKGHNWVTFGVASKPEFMRGKTMCLGTRASLYRDKNKTHSELMLDMLKSFASEFSDKLIYLTVDGAYANEIILGGRPENVHIVSRLRKDAAIYELPEVPDKRGKGAPRKKGDRLPTLQELAKEGSIDYREVEVFIYGETRRVLVKEIEALWYHVQKDKPVKILIVQDAKDKTKIDYLFCTDVSATAEFIIETFASRWSIEVMHKQSKQIMGISDAQTRTQKSVKRIIPFGFFLMTKIMLWYMEYGHKTDEWKLKHGSWYGQKKTPSFADMLCSIRRIYWQKRFFDISCQNPSLKNSIYRMIDLLAKAS